VDHEAPPGLPHRCEDRLLVEGHERPNVHDFGADPFFRQSGGRLEREQHLARPGDDRHVGALALDVGLAERDEVFAGGHRSLGAVQQLVLDEHDRVVVADRRRKEPLRVRRRGRHHDLQPGHVGEPRLERLGVLRGIAAAGAALRADDERHARLAAEHEPVLRRLIDDLVDREAREVDIHELRDRSHAGERSANGGPDEADLADRRLHDAHRAELREQAGRHLERAAVLGDVFAQHDDPRVALHLDAERVVQRFRVEHFLLNGCGAQRRGRGGRGCGSVNDWHRSPPA